MRDVVRPRFTIENKDGPESEDEYTDRVELEGLRHQRVLFVKISRIESVTDEIGNFRSRETTRGSEENLFDQ